MRYFVISTNTLQYNDCQGVYRIGRQCISLSEYRLGDAKTGTALQNNVVDGRVGAVFADAQFECQVVIVTGTLVPEELVYSRIIIFVRL